jgi:hypothetical protein
LSPAFLLAGVVLGLRCSSFVLLIALPLAVALAVLSSVAGWIDEGILPIVLLCVIFEIGFFIGCVGYYLLPQRFKAVDGVVGSLSSRRE